MAGCMGSESRSPIQAIRPKVSSRTSKSISRTWSRLRRHCSSAARTRSGFSENQTPIADFGVIDASGGDIGLLHVLAGLDRCGRATPRIPDEAMLEQMFAINDNGNLRQIAHAESRGLRRTAHLPSRSVPRSAGVAGTTYEQTITVTCSGRQRGPDRHRFRRSWSSGQRVHERQRPIISSRVLQAAR